MSHYHVTITAYLASLQPFDRCETLRSPILHSKLESRIWNSVEAMLRSDNSNVNVQDNIQESVLSGAASTGDVFIIKLLLQHKDINVNLSNFFNGTPLHLVVESGHIEAATLLLGHPSIDVNRRDADETALHKAIKNGNPKILQALLRHPKIDVNAKCSKDYTSLQRLLRRNHWNLLEDPLCDKLAQFLFLHEKLDLSDPVSIDLSGKYGRWLIFELLLDREPSNPLRYWFSDPRALQILLRRRGVSAEKQITVKESLQRLLKDRVISVKAMRPDGKTLFHHAAEEGDEDLMKFLLDHQDLDPKQIYLGYDFGNDEGQQTSMGLARIWGHTKIVDLLKAHSIFEV